MRYLLAAAVMLMVSGCSNGKDGATGPVGPQGPAAPGSSIVGVWSATDPSSRIPLVDLSLLQLNTSLQPVEPVLHCVANMGSGTDISGGSADADFDTLSVSGSSSVGLIKFGRLSHSTSNLNDVCYTVGQETFSYQVDGNHLLLCNIKYDACGTYTKQ